MGDWVNVTLTYNGGGKTTSSNYTIYVNGSSVANTTTGAFAPAANVSKIGVGNASAYFDGNIDEVSIWNIELISSQVSNYYNSGTPTNLAGESGLVAWYRMGDNGIYKSPQWLLLENINKDKVSNYSMSFDGANDYIDCGDSDVFSFGNGTTDSPFSISCWINMVDATDFVPISKDNSGAREYVIRFVGDKLHFYVIDNSTGAWMGRYYNLTMTGQEGNWLHIATTYDGSSTIAGIKIYLNGLRVDDTDYSSGSYTAMENTNTALRIGGQQIGSYYSSGKIDDISIFSSVLSPTKVLSYYNNGEPTDLSSESGLLGYWKMGTNGTFKSTQWLLPNNENKDKFSNYSMSFDGTNDGINCGAVSEIEGLSQVTLSAWIKRDAGAGGPGGWDMVVFKNPLLGFFQWGTNNQMNFKTTTTSGLLDIQSNTGIFDGEWHHLCGTYDGTTQKLFQDGILVDSGAQTGVIATSVNNFWIGIQDGSAIPWVGGIDEISIFDEVKSASDLYNSGVPTDLSVESGLIGYWRMGDGATFSTNWAIPDYSTNSNDGTSANMDIYDRIGDAPSSSGNTVSYNMDIYDRVGDAPGSINNALSYNMVLSGRTTDVPT